MKTKKVLLPFLAFNMAVTMNSYSYAETTVVENKIETPIAQPAAPSALQSAQDLVSVNSKKVWTEFTSALKNARLSNTFNAPTASIGKGGSFGAGYSMESNPSIGGKYSGIDVWNINVSASPEIFGVITGSAVGFSASRQFTFIQQFDDRISSVVRVPYDPVTKIPIKSELFFKKDKNNQPIIKEGDFIAFRAPLTISIGKGANLSSMIHANLDLSLNWIVAGEFDIQIFKMKDNQVRVKIIAVKDNTRGVTVGLNLMGFSPLGSLVLSRLIDTNILQLNSSQTDSDLFLADYIFNLNQPESRDMYDQLIGHKMKMFDQDALATQLKTANPFAKDATTQEHLVGDLDRLNIASEQDQKKTVSERRITRVSTGKNKTRSESWGAKINLFKIAKINSQETKSISRATIYANDDASIQNKYLLETQIKNFSYEWFWLWGQKDLATQSLLLKANSNFEPENLLGFQFNRIKEDASMSKKEFADLKTMFNALLPEQVSAIVKWPNWNFGAKDSVQNAYVQQDLLFTEKLFALNLNVTPEKIKKELIQIIKNFGTFKSRPMNLQPTSGDSGPQDPRAVAFQRHDYINAYSADWEQYVIPIKLAEVFDVTKSSIERYMAYKELNETVPLFGEINNVLLLRLVPADSLSEVIVAKLSMSAAGQEGLDSYYPSKEQYNKSNAFREITYQTNYILNRSYDLRNFMKEDGSTYSTEEIMLQRTVK